MASDRRAVSLMDDGNDSPSKAAGPGDAALAAGAYSSSCTWGWLTFLFR